jgi:hypothetical protein
MSEDQEAKTSKSKPGKREASLLREKMELRREQMKTQLKEWGIDLEIFELRTKKASKDVRAEYKSQIESLRGDLEQRQKQLKELRKHGDEATEEMLIGAEKAWAELSKAFESASTKLKQAESKPKEEPPSNP